MTSKQVRQDIIRKRKKESEIEAYKMGSKGEKIQHVIKETPQNYRIHQNKKRSLRQNALVWLQPLAPMIILRILYESRIYGVHHGVIGHPIITHAVF